MTDWCVCVRSSSTKRQKFLVNVEDKPFVVAKWASKYYPDCEVHVSAHAELRAIYKNGEVIFERKKLSEFYTNVSEQADWEWKHGWKFSGSAEVWLERDLK